MTATAPRMAVRGASAYLLARHGVRIAPATLDKWRCLGGGPEFQKLGRAVFYQPESLDAWIAAQISNPRRSTSDRGIVR